MLKKKSSALILSVALLLVVGCTASAVLNYVNLALNAAEAILPIIVPIINGSSQTPVITPAKAQEIADFVGAAMSGLAAYSDCVAGGGTDAQMGLCATKDLAGILAKMPELQGLPASIATLVQNLATDVQQIISEYPQTASAPGGSKETVHSWSSGQKAKLASYKARAIAVQVKLAAAAAKR